MDQDQLYNEIRDLSTALHGATGRFFQLLEQAIEQHQSATQAVAEQPVAEACEPEPTNTAADSKAWLMLDSSITDVLRVALPEDGQSMQLYAMSRLIMSLIERYLVK
ncbi:hypothetical protein ACP8Y2_06980 [Herpetosiphon llansteffanensis]